MERLPKGQRQRLVREIIGEGSVRTQEELAERLGERGVPVTQATISRDLVELGVDFVQLIPNNLICTPKDHLIFYLTAFR